MSLTNPLPPRHDGDGNQLFDIPDFHGIERYLALSGQNILTLLSPKFAPGVNYPDGEVWDSVTHAQFFYHAHPDGGRADGEHGHFHTFLGADGMPPGLAPLVLPEMGVAGRNHEPTCAVTHRTRRDRGVFSHLVGISVNAHGRPLQLFTTNRWVTGETWYRAEDVARMLPNFAISRNMDGIALVGCWLAGLLRLVRPTVIELLQQRDACMMDWRRRRSRSRHVFDDRRLEIMSSRPVDLRLLERP